MSLDKWNRENVQEENGPEKTLHQKDTYVYNNLLQTSFESR